MQALDQRGRESNMNCVQSSAIRSFFYQIDVTWFQTGSRGALAVIFIIAMVLLPAPIVVASEAQEAGYLVMFEAHGEVVEFRSAAKIENYVPSRFGYKSTDWEARLLGEKGEVLWRGPATNPHFFSPQPSVSEGVQIVVKIPLVMNAFLLVLHDAGGMEQVRVQLDGSFVDRAAIARAQFLEATETNLLRIRARREKSRGIAVDRAVDPSPAFEQLPDDVQNDLIGQIAEEFESIEAYDADTFNLAKTGRLPVEKAHRILHVPPEKTAASSAKAAETLSGVVRDAETSQPVSGALMYFYQYDTSGAYQGFIDSRTTGEDGSYSVVVDEGTVGFYLWNVSGATYAKQWFTVEITGDTTYDVPAVPAIILSGTVSNSDAEPVEGVTVVGSASGWGDSSTTNSSGSYSIRVPKGWSIQLRISPPSPYTVPPIEGNRVFESDITIDWVLRRGWAVSGVVLDGTGQPIEDARVLLRHVAPSTATSVSSYATSTAEGEFEVVAASEIIPPDYVLCVQANGFIRHFRGLTLTGDVEMTISLVEGMSISGVVQNEAGDPLSPVTVRAFDGVDLVTSGRTKSDGSYAFNLAPGLYNFEVVPWMTYNPYNSYSHPFLPEVETDVYVGAPMVRDYTLSEGAGVVDIVLEISDYEIAGTPSRTRYTVMKDGEVITSLYGGSFDWDEGEPIYRYTLTLDSGTFDVAVASVGYEQFVLTGLSVAGTPTVRYPLPARHIWQGVLRRANGMPLADQRVTSYDELMRVTSSDTTGVDGNFTVPISDQGFVVAYAPEKGSSILHTERLGEISGDRTQDIVLYDFPPFVDSGVVSVPALRRRVVDRAIHDRRRRRRLHRHPRVDHNVVNGNSVSGWRSLSRSQSETVPSRLRSSDTRSMARPVIPSPALIRPRPTSPSRISTVTAPSTRTSRLSWKPTRGRFPIPVRSGFLEQPTGSVQRVPAACDPNQAGYDIYDATDTLILERDTLFGGRLQPITEYLERRLFGCGPVCSAIRSAGGDQIVMLNQPIPAGRRAAASSTAAPAPRPICANRT